MSSINRLGSGDGPDNLDSSKSESAVPPWATLPVPVFQVLASKLNRQFFGTLRLVCTEWQQNVDSCLGLKVKVDDSIEGNLEFVQRARIKAARVIRWNVDLTAEPTSFLFQHPAWLQKLKLCGKMPVQWRLHNLQQFSSLAHLVFRDRALYVNNLTGHPLPNPNIDYTSVRSVDEFISEAFNAHQLIQEATIQLPKLRKLEIVTWEFCKRSLLPKYAFLVTLTNCKFILNHLESPLLEVCHLYVGNRLEVTDVLMGNPPPPPPGLNWNNAPIQKFLDSHKTTLRELFLPEFGVIGWDINANDDHIHATPAHIQKLKLELGTSWREGIPLQQTPYVQRFLEGQTHLCDVRLELTLFSMTWVQAILNAISTSNQNTLRYLCVAVGQFHIQQGAFLDMVALTNCNCLETLRLVHYSNLGNGNSLAFRNVDRLPVSLKKVIMLCKGIGGYLELDNPRFFTRLPALNWLLLGEIRPPVDELQETLRAIFSNLLGLRKLQGFALSFEVRLNTDPRIVAMLEPLDPNIRTDAVYPVTNTSYNLIHGRFGRMDESTGKDPFLEKRGLEVYPDLDTRPPLNAGQIQGGQAANNIQDEVDEGVENDMDQLDELGLDV